MSPYDGHSGSDDARFVTVGVGGYRDGGWPPLTHVPQSVGRLRELFTSLGYGHELAELAEGGAWSHIVGRLKAWRGSGDRLVLYWTGHGCVDADEHFLVAGDSPSSRLDGFNAVSATALARFLVNQEFGEVLVLLDCCASGAAASRIATEIGRVIDHSSHAGAQRRFAVIASACGYESAEDGVFAEALNQVVRLGPEDRRWTEHDRTIRSDELADVISRMMAERDGRTAYIARGAPVPALRNPLHPGAAVIPDEDVETKRLRRLRASGIDQHLVLSARGIEVGETGWYFCGRDRLLRRLTGWLDRAGHGLFVVTGSPGTGKSALLGRIATLSDPNLRAIAEAEGALVDTPNAALPTLGCVDIALTCRNKTLDDCLRALVDALRLPVPHDGLLRAPQVVQQVGELRRPVAVVLDGLDEATPAEAVAIAADLLRPLADLPRVRVLVGTRPHRAGGGEHVHDSGPLLQALSPDETAVLDDEPGGDADLVAYALRRLLGAEGSPLRGRDTEARAWAARVARASRGIFLYARVATRAVLTSLADGDVPDGGLERLLAGGLTAVLDEEFARIADPGRVRDLLRPLAWAEGAGLPRRDLWPVLATVLSDDGRVYTDQDITWVLEHAGFHLVEAGESGQTVYRLYHQSLIDHFRALSPDDAQTRIARALLATVGGPDPASWERAHPYLPRHVAAHALAGGLLPRVLRDLGFLMCADPTRTEAAVRSLPDRFSSPVARLYLRAAPRLVPLDPAARLRTLRMTALAEEPSLLHWLQGHEALPVTVEALSAVPDDFSVGLRGHSGPVMALAVCRAPDGRELLASAGGDTTVRVWDPDTGETRRVLTGAATTVTALAGLTDARGRRLLAAAAGQDVLVWDLEDGERVAVLRGHSDTVQALAGLDTGGPPVLASAGKDRRLRLWDPRTWSATVLPGHLGPVAALAVAVLPDGRRLVLSAGADCTVRRWDVDSREPAGGMHGHITPVYALSCLEAADGRVLAVSGAEDGTVRVWDVEGGTAVHAVPGLVGRVRALVPFVSQGRRLLAIAGRASRIRIVDPATGAPVRQLNSRMALSADQETAESALGAQVSVAEQKDDLRMLGVLRGSAYALTALTTGRGDRLLASAGWDGTVRLWDADRGGPPDQPDYDLRRARRVVALPPAEGLEWSLAVVGARDGLRLTTFDGAGRLGCRVGSRLSTRIAALVLPDGQPVLAVGSEHSRGWFVDARTGEEIDSPQVRYCVSWARGDLRSLRAVSNPGRTAVLVVNSHRSGWRALIWRKNGEVETFYDPSEGARSELVPFIRPSGKLQFVRVDREGVVHLHSGTPTAKAREIAALGFAPRPESLPPLLVLCGRRDARLAVVSGERGRPVLRFHALGLFGLTAELTLPCALTHWATLHHDGQDLIVGVGEDENLWVWNPARLDRPPVAVPLPGPPEDLTTAARDLVCVLIEEHWTTLRLGGLDALWGA